MQIKVLHVITDLSIGGAEMMLFRLLSNLDRERISSEVISLTDIGSIGEKIRALGVPVRALGMRRGIFNPFKILKLSKWIGANKPDMVQTWMYHADLVGGLAAKLAGNLPVIWNIRHGTFDYQNDKLTTILTARACAFLSSKLPSRIVCCAKASKEIHEGLGYPAEKMQVIPNGFDLDAYRPNPELRSIIRKSLGIPETAFVIGLIGRFHPQKDHQTFIQTAKRFLQQASNAYFLICGRKINWHNERLSAWIRAEGLEDRIKLLGERSDVSDLNNALDVACSTSSFGEGFPTVIGEAMACGIPCAVTNVGDAAEIVGDKGVIVPSKDPDAMAQAWLKFYQMSEKERRHLGIQGRQRIQQLYQLRSVVGRYEALYETMKKPGKRYQETAKTAVKKRILLVSYAFPPLAAGGSVRIKNFTNYLPKHGWACEVLTLKVPHSQAPELDVPSSDQIHIHRARSLDPYRGIRGVTRGIHEGSKQHILQWLSSFFLIPDRQILWAPFALMKGIRILRQTPCDVIFSTFGPASNHLVAWILKKIFRKPWIADFRDLWATNKNLIMPTPLHQKIHSWLESQVVRKADKVIGVGEHINRELKCHTADKTKFLVISNGYDGALIRYLKEKTDLRSSDVFTLVYAGSFYRKRSPELFLGAVAQLVESGQIPIHKIKIQFVSNFKMADSDYPQIRSALEIRGLTSHRGALEIMSKADAFLLIVENELKHQIVNAKFFDYVAFQKPILALVGDQSVCLPYLDQSGLAFIAHPDDQREIARQLLNIYQCWEKKQPGISPRMDYIKQFDISNLSAQLAGVCETLSGLSSLQPCRNGQNDSAGRPLEMSSR